MTTWMFPKSTNVLSGTVKMKYEKLLNFNIGYVLFIITRDISVVN